MNAPPEPSPPSWVLKRDGRLVPFEADRIARVLFAAAEECGRPDAFLVRELADGVVHFLAGELEGATPSTDQIEEVIIKVVRELGHPLLAETYARQAQRNRQKGEEVSAARDSGDPPPLHHSAGVSLGEIRAASVRQFTLQTVFSRDLASAHHDELIQLTGLDTPEELAGCLLRAPISVEQLVGRLEEIARRAGEWVILEGPEYALLANGLPGELTGKLREAEELADRWVKQLLVGLRLTGRRAILNLNGAQPPAWAEALAEGPLFVGQRRIPENQDRALLVESLLAAVCTAPPGEQGLTRLRVDWHLAASDFEPLARERLLNAVRLALAGMPITFVFDRPRRLQALAEGVDRRRTAVLLTVGLNLPRLATLVCEECPALDETGKCQRVLARLKSLVRLALSAGVQKRDYLRSRTLQSGFLAEAFLLDRARLLVTPFGLEQAVHSIWGRGLCAGGAALDFGEQLLQRIRELLQLEGRTVALECCVDAPLGTVGSRGTGPSRSTVAGPTCWDPAAPVKSQLRTLGKLHAVCDGGTGKVLLPSDPPPTADQVADWLRTAWHQTEIVRLCWLRPPTAHRQLTFAPAD